MINLFRNILPKYFYEPDDVIYIMRSAVYSPEGKHNPPVLLRVAVLQRLSSGYIVQDADDLRYFIKHKYVVSKE